MDLMIRCDNIKTNEVEYTHKQDGATRWQHKTECIHEHLELLSFLDHAKWVFLIIFFSGLPSQNESRLNILCFALRGTKK